MQQHWRPTLDQHIKDRYIQNPQEEWYDFTLSTSGLLNITIVSNIFAKIPFKQRDEQIQKFLRELFQGSDAPTATGFLSLYTTSEADDLALSRPPAKQDTRVDNWSDLARAAMNPSETPKAQQPEPGIPYTVTFYSFKGGVGRTTALIHVAWILAMRGRRVVAVDLDLEAPGLSALPNLTPAPKYGIVDYFYERTYMPRDVEPRISIADIFGEVHIPNAPGGLFIVPAGFLNPSYITKLDDLRASAVTKNGEDLWSVFLREITKQLQPDIILVDSRTGINEWGAFSLLKAAHQAIVFLYPNEQNKRGIDLLLETLANKVTLQLVFSPVPSIDAGEEIVKEYWRSFQSGLSVATNQLLSDANEEMQEVETQADLAEPIIIKYSTDIALASSYPVDLQRYMSIANVVDKDTFAISLKQVLGGKQKGQEEQQENEQDERQNLLKSLEFLTVNTASPKTDLKLFQRTAAFERFLADTTSLIRGQKGSGKTILYNLLLNYPKYFARDLSYRQSERAISYRRPSRMVFLSGHDRSVGHPTSADFRFIDQSIKENDGSWDAFWVSYLSFRMYMEYDLQLFKEWPDRFNPLWSMLDEVPRDNKEWQEEHTRVLAKMATHLAQNLDPGSIIQYLSRRLRNSGEILWFLFDDLDKDLPEKDNLRDDALTGLFRVSQLFERIFQLLEHRSSIQFKIFLREDIWRQLQFDGKNYFNGRNIILQWTREDFLRLALRQARHSKKFKDLVDLLAPVEDIDEADEASLDRALQLLWGVRREPNSKSQYVSRWVYDRLTDASGTAFPGSVNVLLTRATEHALDPKTAQDSPTIDRLLPAISLQEGILEASKQRCKEVREEYPELKPFFDALTNLEALISKQQLEELGEKHVKDIFPDSGKFVEFLLYIGLIRLVESRGREPSYQFADIYATGFNMHGRRK